MTVAGGFRVGAVIRRTIDVLGDDMPRFLGLMLAFDLLPQLLGLALAPRFAPAPDSAPGVAATLPSTVVELLVFLVSSLGKGSAVAAALAACEGRPWTFRSAVGIGATAFPSNLGVQILSLLGFGFASLLFLVPGLMLLCRWAVAVSANVAERPGARAALGRSRDLTEGHRWPIFGLLLLFYLIGSVVPLAASLLGFRQGVDAGFEPFALANVLSAAVSGLVGDVGTAALYVELRAAEGGASSSDLVSAFD